jgi:hypothetical protein
LEIQFVPHEPLQLTTALIAVHNSFDDDKLLPFFFHHLFKIFEIKKKKRVIIMSNRKKRNNNDSLVKRYNRNQITIVYQRAKEFIERFARSFSGNSGATLAPLDLETHTKETYLSVPIYNMTTIPYSDTFIERMWSMFPEGIEGKAHIKNERNMEDGSNICYFRIPIAFHRDSQDSIQGGEEEILGEEMAAAPLSLERSLLFLVVAFACGFMLYLRFQSGNLI